MHTAPVGGCCLECAHVPSRTERQLPHTLLAAQEQVVLAFLEHSGFVGSRDQLSNREVWTFPQPQRVLLGATASWAGMTPAFCRAALPSQSSPCWPPHSCGPALNFCFVMSRALMALFPSSQSCCPEARGQPPCPAPADFVLGLSVHFVPGVCSTAQRSQPEGPCGTLWDSEWRGEKV